MIRDLFHVTLGAVVGVSLGFAGICVVYCMHLDDEKKKLEERAKNRRVVKYEDILKPWKEKGAFDGWPDVLGDEDVREEKDE